MTQYRPTTTSWDASIVPARDPLSSSQLSSCNPDIARSRNKLSAKPITIAPDNGGQQLRTRRRPQSLQRDTCARRHLASHSIRLEGPTENNNQSAIVIFQCACCCDSVNSNISNIGLLFATPMQSFEWWLLWECYGISFSGRIVIEWRQGFNNKKYFFYLGLHFSEGFKIKVDTNWKS